MRNARHNCKGLAQETNGYRWRRFVCWLVMVTFAFPPSPFEPAAQAQSYRAGFTKYTQADFPGAERACLLALKKRLPRKEKAKVAKLLGIVQHIQGKASAAKKSFKMALALDRSSTISAAEALDPSVIPFFNGVKATYRPPQPKARPTPKPTPKAKRTYLKVVSNVPSATVTIDGILAGKVGALIDSEPGKVRLEVNAPGFVKRAVRTTVVKGRENTVKVVLSKPKPKATPTPRPTPKPKPKPKPRVNVAASNKRGGGGGRRGNRGGGRKVYAPNPGDDLFDDPGGGAGGGAPGQDLASEFNRDAAAGAYGGAPQPYGQPQPQPYAAPQPVYPAPQPVYPAPQPVYPAPAYPYQPPPPAAPPPSGYDPYADPGPGDPAAEDEPDVDVGGRKSSSSGSGGTFYKILPFGGGQFARGDTLLGLAFLAAEAGAIGFYFMRTQEAADVTAQTETEIKQLVDRGESRENIEAFRAARQQYVDDLNNQATYGLAGFAGLWGLGIAEAFINEPAPKKKRRRKRRRRYGEWRLLDPKDRKAAQIAKLDLTARPDLNQFDFDLGLQPISHPQTNTIEPGVGVKVEWKF